MLLNRSDTHNSSLIGNKQWNKCKIFMMLTSVWIVSYLSIMAKVAIWVTNYSLMLARNFILNL